MKHTSAQQRFGHRRRIAVPKPSTTRKTSRQSTLTQLAFVSTPVDREEDSDPYISDVDDDLAAVQPRKRRRLEPSSSTNTRRNATLTQIGFLGSAEVLATDSEGESDEFVAASPAQLEVKVSSDIASSRIETIPSSPPANSARNALLSTVTPNRARRIELPSSQTPASIALSTTHRREITSLESSPLHERSTNVHASPSRALHGLKRTLTVQDSQCEDITLATQTMDAEPRLIRTFTVQDSQGEDLSLSPQRLLPQFDDHDYDDDLNPTYVGTMAADEQCTWDPADSALDRDAARFAITQLQPSIMANNTKIPVIGDNSDEEAELKSGLRPSQISTVLPTQSSPHPIAFTSASMERQHAEAIVISSSPLPIPPWTVPQSVNNDSVDPRRHDPGGDLTSLPDFSLPPPPTLNWSSSQGR